MWFNQFNHLKRRDVITLLGGAAAWPLAAHAQRPERMRHIGYLRAAPPPERELQALLRALAEHGYVQGRNFALVTQWGDGRIERLPELAVALVNSGVDIIVTEGTLSVRAVHAVTTTVPIVMVGVADPFVFGIIKNLSRPGGNITGFSSLNVDIAGKTLEILKEMVPGLGRVAVLVARQIWELFASVENEAAKALAMDLVYVNMAVPEAAGAATRQAVSAGAQGAVLRGTPFFSSVQRTMIVDNAAEHRLPMIYESREFVEQGGLVCYATDAFDLYRLSAGYVARILAGTKPGDLPIQQPTKFELVINLNTAKALGLEVLVTLLARADAVIE
jgi:putative ABC transport system substrate-binding protein